MRRMLAVLVLVAASCGGSGVSVDAVPELPAITAEEFQARLTASSRPAVVNVWASWCIPCRSEAPLLAAAARDFAGDVDFVGINVQDSQAGARAFIAEFAFGLDGEVDHYFDPDRAIPAALGGTPGVPLTYFYAPGGGLVDLHTGIIDERSLALGIDELLGR